MFSKSSNQEAAHKDAIWCAEWGRCPTAFHRLLTASCDENVGLWDTESELSLAGVFPEQGSGAVSVVCSSRNPIAVSSAVDCRIRVLDLEQNNVRSLIECGPIECWTLAMSADGNKVASGTYTGAVNVWNLETSSKMMTLEAPGSGFALDVAYSPDDKLLAAGCKDGLVRVFDTKTGKITSSLTNHMMSVQSVCFSKDGKFLFSCGDDQTVNIYDPKKDSSAITLRGHLGRVLSVDCTPDGRHLVTGSSDKTVKIWDLENRRCIQTLESHSDSVYSVSFNNDGTKLASVGGEGMIQVYSITNST